MEVSGQLHAPTPNHQERPWYSPNRERLGSRAFLDLLDKRKVSTAAGEGGRTLPPARSLAAKPTTLSQLLFDSNVKINVP